MGHTPQVSQIFEKRSLILLRRLTNQLIHSLTLMCALYFFLSLFPQLAMAVLLTSQARFVRACGMMCLHVTGVVSQGGPMAME